VVRRCRNRPGDPTVIVLGHGLWKRAFGGDRASSAARSCSTRCR
jgi:hypothetical protein